MRKTATECALDCCPLLQELANVSFTKIRQEEEEEEERNVRRVVQKDYSQGLAGLLVNVLTSRLNTEMCSGISIAEYGPPIVPSSLLTKSAWKTDYH